MPPELLPTLHAAFWNLFAVMTSQVPFAIGLAVLFSLLSLFQSHACNPGRPWWKSRDLLTDVHYFFLMPILGPYIKLFTLLMIMVAMRGAMSEDDVEAYVAKGLGPIGQLPLWAQVIFYVVVGDFLLYLTHRFFHKQLMWPFHAVHHSSLDVDWTTAYRSHPINQMLGSGLVTSIMIVLGVSPTVMLWVVPFDVITAAFVHANLNWTLGPLKYVIATPVFHRWHHTGPEEGGECNFSSTFSLWDWLFGTFYMPEGQLPQEYGVDDPLFPTTWAQQMVVPFKQFLALLQAEPKSKSAT